MNIGAVGDVEEQSLAVEFEVGTAWPFGDLKAVAASPDVVRLPGDHLSFGLSLDGSELVLLPFDPGHTLHDGQTDKLVVKALRCSDTDAAHRRVDPDV